MKDVVAWKRIRPRANQSWKVVMREVETLRERRHRVIVPLLASFTLGQFESEEASLNLLFPCARMNMHQWLRLTKSPEELQCLGFDGQRKYLYSSIFSLVSALSFLHRPIDGKVTSHHDLKPHNILFLDGTLKICDFGRTHLMDWSTGSETAGEHGLGTPTYHPPEFYNDDGSRSSVNHGRSFDIWSMGCIIIEIATLILYGWEAGKVQEFQNKRLDSEPQRWKKIDDDSFHNNMDCVRAWVSEMRGHDESSPQFVRTLTIADRMLRENPEDRLYSWESELDLYELLYPDLPNSHRAQTEASRVQGPRQKKFVRRVETPLHRACMDENEHRVQKLLLAGWPTEVKDSMGHTALQIAESRGWNRLVRILSAPATQLQQSHSERAEQSPYDSGSREIQEFFLDEIDDGGDGKTALHYAAEKGLQYDVEKILATTPNKWRVISAEDDEGLTPLHWAARKGHKDVLDTLLLSDGHETEDYLHKVDNSGQTLLHHACYFGHTDVALLLLEKYQPHGNSVAALLAKDVTGKTPLHWAAQRGHLETVEALLMAGTSMETLQQMLEERDDNGKDACQLAQRAKVVDLLQGAKQKGTGTVKYHTHR